MNFRDFQFALALLFAIEEINNSTELLPGISLGYKIFDTCGSMVRSGKVALDLISSNEAVSAPSDMPCSRPAEVQAIIGDSSSSTSMVIATVIGLFQIPVVGKFSYFKSCV